MARRAKLELLDGHGDRLNGRLRHRVFHGHRLLRFPAQGSGKVQRLDIENFKGFSNFAHVLSLLRLAAGFLLPKYTEPIHDSATRKGLLFNYLQVAILNFALYTAGGGKD